MLCVEPFSVPSFIKLFPLVAAHHSLIIFISLISPSLPPSLLYHSASLSLSCLIFTGLLRWVHVIEITGVHMRWKHTHFPHLDYARITQDNASFLLLITLSKGWSDGSSAWQF